MPAPRDAEPGERGGLLARLAPLALVALALFAYGNGFDGAFLFDDHIDITGNPAIRSLWPPTRVVLDQGQSGVSGRPLVALSYALNWRASPPDAQGVLDPWGWHAVNLAIHVLAALFLYGCVRRALRLPRFAERWGASATPIAFAAAALWVAHPLTTGAVMYIGQRVESGMGLCLLATFYAALRAFEVPGSKLWPRLALLACALGTGCKEVIAAAPILVLAFDALYVAGSWKEAWRARRGLHAGLFATWLLIALWVALAEGRSQSVGFGYAHVGVWEYLTTQAWAVARYVRLSLWPSPLVFDYGVRPVTEVARWLAPGLGVLALLALTAWGLAKRSGLAFLGAWWFVILAPTSSVLPIVTELVVEHRAYLPLAAVVLLAVLGAHALLARFAPGVRGAALGALGLLGSLGLAFATRARNLDYRTEIGMWADIVAKFPENDRAQACYGNDLMAAAAEAQAAGRFDEAQRFEAQGIAQYRRAVELAPENASWRTNVGIWHLSHGRTDEALAAFEEALRNEPDHSMALQNAGVAYQRRGDVERAIEVWSKALDSTSQAKPWIAQQLAPLLAARGRHAEALAALRKALAAAPDDVALNLMLARSLLQSPEAALRNPGEAAQLAQRAFRLGGGTDAGALELAGEALAAQNRTQEAALAFQQAAAVWRALGQAVRADAALQRAQKLLNPPR